ncbi:M23 family metallopeptidase [Bacillus horti]|uniref:Stage II sporulation protein Q n=1 Tax=Caldalkalibacillus horti TaxID=77523 RepID=A0ABT9VZZ6_9BACI|nr:M23 family metallopeptidase [Bacillus horti]MDQ0166430.1 stage II sporulation protein Q [Bacillus horti]
MKEDQNQNNPAEEQKEEQYPNPSSTGSSGWKKMIKKKWFFPAIYLVAAALILALITWYQNPNDFAIDSNELGFDTEDDVNVGERDDDTALDDESMPVNTQQEDMIRPVADNVNVQVVLSYFEDVSSAEDNLQAMVEYDNTFYPSRGVSFAMEDQVESFDVHAALSGTVILADKSPLVGNYVEIEHEDGLVTVYQSLEHVQVSEGDRVQQGDVIGQAGRNELHKELGVHVHFEVHENGEPVNPNKYLRAAE